MKKAIRLPHLALSDFERREQRIERRARNCILAVIAIFIAVSIITH